MKLRSNSPIMKTYCWLYGKPSDELGQNFCPIFWMMVLGAFILVPYTLFCTPAAINEYFDKNYRNGDRDFGERLGISGGVYAVLFALVSICSFFYALLGYMNMNDGLAIPGALFTAGLIIILSIICGGKYLSNRKKERNAAFRSAGQAIPDTIGEIIANTWSSFYDKHCPRITWIDPQDPLDPTDNGQSTNEVHGQELVMTTDPILGTNYRLKNITTNTESNTLEFPNL